MTLEWSLTRVSPVMILQFAARFKIFLANVTNKSKENIINTIVNLL